MEQTILCFDAQLKKARKEIFLDEISVVVPWP
jgi:hypothetical protein